MFISQTAPFSHIVKKFCKIHNECRKGVAEKEQSEALTNEVRTREFWDFSARAFYGINYLCKIYFKLNNSETVTISYPSERIALIRTSSLS